MELSYNDDDIIHDFEKKRKELTQKASCGRDYVLVEELSVWLKSRWRADRPETPVALLLKAAYRDRKERGYPIELESICNGDDCCLLVFSILLACGSGKFIHQFWTRDIVDRHLPMDLAQLRSRIEPMNLDKQDLAVHFDSLQWQFFPVKLEFDSVKIHPEKRILPICKKEKINEKGGTAQLYQIAVQEEFVGPSLRKAVLSPRYQEKEFGRCYQFALKSFNASNMFLYESERDAFYSLRGHEGMVQYLGAYEHCEVQEDSNTPKQTFNILLEYGELDLEEYFYDRLPPLLGIEVHGFWSKMADVAKAISVMHNPTDNGDYYGWHADIKPDNILIVDGRFKLADPGFAKVLKREMHNVQELLIGGTKTYGAPEIHESDKRPTTLAIQSCDVWSLGCVLSIAATWVVLGYEGTRQFNKLREDSVKTIRKQSVSTPSSIIAGDYFHDGRKVLEDITSWHKVLRSALRRTDQITNKVLDLVDKHMFVESKERLSAKKVCEELAEILSQERSGPPNLPTSIMTALLKVDNEATPRVSTTNSMATTESSSKFPHGARGRNTRKSQFTGKPLMKTTNRSETLGSALRSSASGLGSEDVTIKVPYTRNRNTSTSLFSPDLKFARMSAKERKPLRSQNVWQTRQEIEEREKSRGLQKMRKFMGKTQKDEHLSRYFKNRDIRFLVDNAETMSENWYEATYLLETLVMKAAGQDENGVDLSFTLGEGSLKNQKNFNNIKKQMESDSVRPKKGMHTDLRQSFGMIFEQYVHDLQRQMKWPSSTVKDLTLIVLTDGIWEGIPDKREIDRKIVAFVSQVERIAGKMKERRVSIEFVQFGKDAEATARLRYLDDNLKYEGVSDVVDTTPSSGDVNKMLLGSFVQEYDDDDETEEDSPGPKSTIYT